MDERVLLVEDDASIREVVGIGLRQSGMRPTGVADGRDALAQFRQATYDVVLLDVMLPSLDGFEVLREIVRHDGVVGRVTGVVAVSGDASPTTCQTMLGAGADDFISRPFENGEFALRVRQIAHRTRSLRRALGYVRLLDGSLHDPSHPS